MSFDFTTRGFENYESFTLALVVCGIPFSEETKGLPLVRGPFSLCHCEGDCGHKQSLRTCRFVTPSGRRMVAEEYLAVMSRDCDGEDQIAIAVYPEGHRPNLFVEEVR